jgi:hypothetical protein
MDGQGSQKCTGPCGQVKPLSEFSFKNEARGWLHHFCRECHKQWNRSHYERNKATYVANARRNSARYRVENLERVVEYLRAHPCVDCGISDLVVLDFDHRDPSTKRMPVSMMIDDFSWAEIAKEIAKCDVRCANDHRRRTARQFGYRKVALALLTGQGRQDLNLQPSVLETDALPIELRP